MNVVAVVLAGGASSRFGSDKLAARVDRQSLLDHTLAALPQEWAVVVVGPRRRTTRPARFTREQPPGGGPAAALVAGLRAALDAAPDAVVVVPGDAPAAGEGALTLLAGLADHQAAVGVDAVGRLQPLQLALRPGAARRLVDLAGPEEAAGQSARPLITALDPVRIPLEMRDAYDVDTPDQLLVWRLQTSPAIEMIMDALPHRRPVAVALDGHSGAGKSCLATALALRAGGTVLEGDDFYQPALASLAPDDRNRMSAAEAADIVIDWRRLRSEALEPLARGEAARFRPYDWDARDGRLAEPRLLRAGDVVVVDGVYSARSELADLVDLAVLVETDEATRADRLARRKADDPDWAAFWERAEQHYFRFVRPPSSFDVRIAPSE